MPLATTPPSFRQVQIFWGVAIAFAVVCIGLGGTTRKAFEGGIHWQHWVLVGLVLWSFAGGLSTLRKLIAGASAAAKSGNPLASTKRLTAAQLLGIGTAESIVLWGLVSNVVIASPEWLSDAFYVAGILLLFRFKPTKPAYVLGTNNPGVVDGGDR
jgi:hypothetical protein